MIKSNTKIQPLLEDLGRLVPGEFLKSTECKRWMVERNLDEVWNQCVRFAGQSRSFFMVGYDHDAAPISRSIQECFPARFY